MALLLTILGQFAIEIAIAGMVLLVEVAASVIALAYPTRLVQDFLAKMFASVGLALRTTPSRRLRKLGYVVVALCASITGCFMAVNTIAVEPLARWTCARIKATHGIDIHWASLDGSLLTGKLSATGVALVRVGSQSTDLDLRIDAISLDLAVLPALLGKVRFDSVRLTGLHGNVAKRGEMQRKGPWKSFEVLCLSIDGGAIDFRDETHEPATTIAVQVEEIESRPLRSRWAFFDLLICTTGKGTLNGGSFTLDSTCDASLGVMHLDIESLPIKGIARYLGQPVSWISEGVLSARIRAEGLRDGSGLLSFAVSMAFGNLLVVPPTQLDGAAKQVAARMTEFMNTHAERLPLDFDLEWNLAEFRDAATAREVGFWDSLGRVMGEALAGKAGITLNELLDKLPRSGGAIKNALEELKRRVP